ncbi:tRNA1(Val) (adenine(37)-N6)-methyltransferase [Spongiimicrobium salis]|uniref:tRNA1(Val) (adenine(37)-N6)-methyltransferase n=1 Tax=Spongiimicrobium salis TaxID=1667022 RepID=UPI00374D2774
MKIGTDGVLLGAWTAIDTHPNSILDIGAGTGVIALQLAQRSHAEIIDGIEIDAEAYEQCVSNFENSPWADRLFCYHAGLDELTEEIEEHYDLIVSNPPYFPPNEKAAEEQIDAARKTARFYDALPFEALLQGVAQLLSPLGVFSTIIPYQEEEKFLALAKALQLFPKRITRVKGHAGAPTKRSLLEFHRLEKTPIVQELTIELERHQYTPEYIALTKDFYLKM